MKTKIDDQQLLKSLTSYSPCSKDTKKHPTPQSLCTHTKHTCTSTFHALFHYCIHCPPTFTLVYRPNLTLYHVFMIFMIEPDTVFAIVIIAIMSQVMVLFCHDYILCVYVMSIK